MKPIKIGCSPLSRTIYAGHLNKKGNEWLNKEDVTTDALVAVAQLCLAHGDQEICSSGKVLFEISVKDLRTKE